MAADSPSRDTIFCVAIEIASAEERAAYIARECGDDEALRAEVHKLVAAHFRAGSFLEGPAPDPRATAADDSVRPEASATEQPGVVLAGRYKLLEAIGVGGMGTVWLAQQTEPVKRLVAVKLIKTGMDSKTVLARFEAERQAVALMDHPNIAKVLDAGESNGRPFFVMELVKGVPITQYCDEQHLTLGQRLELFVPVCQAIQHAHHKGIIHRDIKPRNVLVARYDDRPVPKVIDFGVAKATGQQLTEQTLHTGFGTVVGTVEYMSPEQAGFNQLDVDTRSDVYALGVLLYELLAGSPPFARKELEKAGLLEILRLIREQEPTKPSTRLSTADGLPALAANRGTEPKKLSGLVRGELDWIVMKALEKDRSRRYETANGFAMDVQRYLADEAVLACPPSAMYRFRKFARRNKTGLAVAGLIMFFLVLLVGGAGWALRDRASRREHAVEDAKAAWADVAQLRREGKWPAALAVAKRAEALLASGGDPEFRRQFTELRRDLELAARLEEIRISQGMESSHRPDKPRKALEYSRAFRDHGIDVEALGPAAAAERIRARAIPEELAAALDDWADVRRQRDEAGSKGLRAMARAIDPDPWRNRLREALENREPKPLEELATSDECDRLPPSTLYRLAVALEKLKGRETAVAVLRRAQKLHPDHFWINIGLADHLTKEPATRVEAIGFCRAALALRPQSPAAHNALGGAHYFAMQYREAIDELRRAIELEPDAALVHCNLGWTLSLMGRSDEAIGAYREAIRVDPAYARAHYYLAQILRNTGRLDESLAAYRRALVAGEKQAAEFPDWPEFQSQLALILHDMAGDPKKPTEACQFLERAIVHQSAALRIDPQHVAYPRWLGNHYIALAQLLAECRVPEVRNVKRAIELAKQALQLRSFDGGYWYALGGIHSQVGNWTEAIAAYKEAIRLKKYKHAEADNDLAWLLATCSDSQFRNPVEAVRFAKQAVELTPKEGGYWNTLGVAHYRAGNSKEAVVALEKAMELRKGGDSSDWFFLAMAHWQLGEKDKARQWYDRAVQWMEKNNPNDEELRRFRAEAAALLKIAGKLNEKPE